MPLLTFTVEDEEAGFDAVEFQPVFAGTPTTFDSSHDVLSDVDEQMLPFTDMDLNPHRLVIIGEGGTSGGPMQPVTPQYIRGQVLDIDGNGVPRVVIAIDRATGRRLAITTSDISGNFLLRPATLDPCILIAVPLLEEQLNVVALDNILPVPD
jgi:hypothetical protein